MSINLNLGKWGAIFPVPNSVVDEEIRLASANQLKVLLYVLRNNTSTLTEKYVGEQLNILEDDVKDAILYWIDRGVLSSDGNIPDEEKPEISENKPKAEINKTDTEPVKKKPRLVSRPQKPDSIFVAERLNNDPELASLLQEIEAVFGRPISSGDTATVVMLHETVGLPCDVLMMLIYYCHSIGKDNMRYIEKMGIGWADDEITTIERAEEKIANLQLYGEAWSKVAEIFGIRNTGSPTKAQQENANRWINEWKFSEEMLREAYERCVNTKNTFSLTYTNGILKNWKKYNINSLKELNEFEEKKTKSNKKTAPKSEASYDIEEYENFSLFD